MDLFILTKFKRKLHYVNKKKFDLILNSRTRWTKRLIKSSDFALWKKAIQTYIEVEISLGEGFLVGTLITNNECIWVIV